MIAERDASRLVPGQSCVAAGTLRCGEGKKHLAATQGSKVVSQRIGVIGGGVAGLASAWLLASRFEVTLLERNSYIGGHSHTVPVEGPHGPFWVDTGFMVYNRRNYPELTALFKHLGVSSYPTDMSFSASIDDGRLEYAGTRLGTLFAQRRNLLRTGFLRMLRDIVAFNRSARRYLAAASDNRLTVAQFVSARRYSREFVRHYLLPMAAAIWSSPTDRILQFPFATFARFLHNHGLLDLTGRPQWRTVSGGSRSYVAAMLRTYAGDYRVGCPVRRLWRRPDGVRVETTAGERIDFARVVMACHADQAVRLIDDPTTAETETLGRFCYQPNRVVLHTDPSLMPRMRRVWSSWNYLRRSTEDAGDAVSVTYWMNRLQQLPTTQDVFVTLNPRRGPMRQEVLGEFDYEHPLFDAEALAAQRRLGRIQGAQRLWFCGSYCGYGFHEDALCSAIRVAALLGVRTPWAQRAQSGLVHSPMPRRPIAESG